MLVVGISKMNREIAAKLNNELLKHMTICAGVFAGDTGELSIRCEKCFNSNHYHGDEVKFEEFLTDLIMWAVSHKCKEKN